MDEHSEEAWDLFRLYGEEFPPEMVAKKYVPRAFGSDSRSRTYAIEALGHAGPDARKVAALASVVQQRVSLEKQADSLAGLKYPGPYSGEMLKLIRRRENFQLRLAVIAALGRSGKFEKELMDILRGSLHDPDPIVSIEAGRVAKNMLLQKNVSQAQLEERLLTGEDPLILKLASLVLKKGSLSQDFRQKLFQRIDAKRSADVNLIFIECLLKHAEPNSETQKKLLKLKTAMQSLRILETDRQLAEDLRWIVEQTRKNKQQMQNESIEQLKKLGLLD